MLENKAGAAPEPSLSHWLESIGLGEYAALFLRHQIGFDVVSDLTERDLAEIGMPLGDRKRLRRAMAAKPPMDGAATPERTTATSAERRQLTAMFCDMVGAGLLSEQHDPEDVREMIAGFRETCVRIVNKYEGFAARYVVDGILVYFGYPIAHEDDAERAVHAGLEIVQALAATRADTTIANGHLPQARIGIATGLAVVGDMIGQGTEERAAAVGETLNLAARLQGIAPANGVVISAATRALLKGRFEYQSLGAFDLKGISDKTQAWHVLRPARSETRFAATVGPKPTSFVNREEELALVLSRWRQAQQGHGQVVLLSGEPGIGKSRLLEEIRDRIAGDRHTQVSLQCSPYYNSTAFHPFIQQLKFALGLEREETAASSLARIEASVKAAHGDVARVAPLLAALLSVPTDERYEATQLSPLQQKDATVTALADHLTGLAYDQPQLIVFEDVHWIDPTSREVLDLLADRIQSAPVLLIVTGRPEFQASWNPQYHITTRHLKRLGRPLQIRLVERVAGAIALPKEIIDEITVKTDGVPLFIEELTKTVIESDALSEKDGRYVLSGSLHQLAIPATLADSLMARLDRMGPFKRIAQIGGTIGREFAYELLCAIADMPTAEIDAALDHLDKSGLIGRQGQGQGWAQEPAQAQPRDAVYAFKHVLIQDAARSSLLLSERRTLHARIAAALGRMYPERIEREPELLAYHLTESGQSDPAARAWLKAGKQAARFGAFLEAIGHLRRGLAVIQSNPRMRNRQPMELELRLGLGHALIAAKGYGMPEVEENFARALELGRALDDEEKTLSAIRGLWMRHFIRADLAKAHDLTVELLSFARRPRSGDAAAQTSHLVEAHRSIGMTMLYRGRFRAAQHHLHRAMRFDGPRQRGDLAERLISPDVISLSYLGYLQWFLGHSDAARRDCARATASAEAMRHPFTLAFALVFAAYLHQHLRDVEATRDHAARAIAVASEHGLLHWKHQATILHGWALTELGEVETGLSEMRAGIDGYEALDSLLASCWFRSLLAQGYARAGLTDAALRTLDDALVIAERTGDHFYLAELYRLQGEINLAHAGLAAGADAEELFLRSLEISRAQGARSWELRGAISMARLWRDRGQPDLAAGLLMPVLRGFTEGLLTPDLIEAVELANGLNGLSSSDPSWSGRA